MVCNRCAIAMTVIPLAAFSSPSCSNFSDSASNALVDSSKINNCGFRTSALAIDNRCF